MPGLDQPPHVPADLRSGGRDPVPLVRADLVQRPPQRRVRGDRPEQLGLIPQHRQVRHHPAPVGDQHRGVGQYPAAVVHRGEPAAAQRPGQRPGQPGSVGQQPQRRGPGARHHPVPADFHGQIPRPRGKLIHLKGAPRSRQNVGFDTLILPGQGHLSPFRHTPPQDRHELTGLACAAIPKPPSCVYCGSGLNRSRYGRVGRLCPTSASHHDSELLLAAGEGEHRGVCVVQEATHCVVFAGRNGARTLRVELG